MSKPFQKRENKLSQTRKGTRIFHMDSTTLHLKYPQEPGSKSHHLMVTGNIYLVPKYFFSRVRPNQNEDDPWEWKHSQLHSIVTKWPADFRTGGFNKRKEDWGPQGTQGEGRGQARQRKAGDTSGDGWGMESHPCTLHTFLGLVTVEPNPHLRFINGDETMRWMYCVPEKMLN